MRIDLIDSFELFCGELCKEYKCVIALEPKHKVKTEACELSATESVLAHDSVWDTIQLPFKLSSLFKLECDVYWTVHHCDNWRKKLDATNYFIILLMASKCFGHYYAHHQELATIMLITTLVVSFLVCCMLEVRHG